MGLVFALFPLFGLGFKALGSFRFPRTSYSVEAKADDKNTITLYGSNELELPVRSLCG